MSYWGGQRKRTSNIEHRTSNIEHPTLNIEVEEEEIYRQAAKVAKGRREGEEWGVKF